MQAPATPRVVPIDARQRELVERVSRLIDCDGIARTAFPPLHVIRASAPAAPLPSVYTPSLCVVVQGRKRALVGREEYYYDPFNYLLVSMTLPARGEILEASPERPYLCLRLDIDMGEVSRLLLELEDRGSSAAADGQALYVARMSGELLDVVLRLTRLLDTPEDLPVLGALALREIWYRLLRGEMGGRLRALAQLEGPVQRIARAVELLKRRFADALRVDQLAEAAHMSPSALHARFKAVTGLSPLQFQKQLRLHEARRLMLSEGLDATSAAYRVGYESSSHFSRDYRRAFGAPPRREVERLRQRG